MTNYVKTTDFAAKDNTALPDAQRLVKGTEFEVEFDNIADAVNSKANADGSNASGTWDISITGSASSATNAQNVYISDTNTSDTTAYLTLVGANNLGHQQPFVDSNIWFNGTTSTLYCPNFSGTASYATTAGTAASATLAASATTAVTTTGITLAGTNTDTSIYPVCVGTTSTVDNQLPLYDSNFYFNALYDELHIGAMTIAGYNTNVFLCSNGPTTWSNSYNSGFGPSTLTDLGSGSRNTAMGYLALANVTSGDNNTAIGQAAGVGLTTGDYSTYVGNFAAPATNSATGELVVCAGVLGSTGKGSSTGFIDPNGGGVYQGNNSSSWSTTSDARIKQNFVNVDNGLEVINGLNPVQFDYILTGKHDVGFKAQEYMTVLPDQVKKHAASPKEKELVGEDEIYGIDRNLDPYFVSAIKELTMRLEKAEAKLAQLGVA